MLEKNEMAIREKNNLKKVCIMLNSQNGNNRKYSFFDSFFTHKKEYHILIYSFVPFFLSNPKFFPNLNNLEYLNFYCVFIYSSLKKLRKPKFKKGKRI